MPTALRFVACPLVSMHLVVAATPRLTLSRCIGQRTGPTLTRGGDHRGRSTALAAKNAGRGLRTATCRRLPRNVGGASASVVTLSADKHRHLMETGDQPYGAGADAIGSRSTIHGWAATADATTSPGLQLSLFRRLRLAARRQLLASV